jgi:DNA gyrase subunit A
VTLIALDDGAKLSGLHRIVENDANGEGEDAEQAEPPPTEPSA